MTAQSDRSVPSGYVTFNSKAIMAFKNLKIEGKTIIFEIENTGNVMEFNLEAVESIANSAGEIVYSSKNMLAVNNNLTDKKPISNNENSQTNNPILIYQSRSAILFKENKLSMDELYSKLRNQNPNFSNRYKRAYNWVTVGNVLMPVGVLAFAGGAVTNLQGSGIGPAPLIFGIALIASGLTVRLVALDSAKQVITDYNISTMNAKPHAYKAQLDFIASGQGIGLKCSF
jgi:hypothetical protein